MKNNILTHKIIPILAIFVFCFFSICVTNVNASYTVVSGDKEYIFPDDVNKYNYFIAYIADSKGPFIGVFWSDTGNCFKYSNGGIQCYTDTTFSILCDYSFYYLEDSSLTDFSACTKYTRSFATAIYNTDEPFVYSTTDIYAADSSIFFPQAPLGITQTLAKETMKTQIMEQMRITIVGFLKYLMLLVISVIAFFKAWKFLSTSLRKA